VIRSYDDAITPVAAPDAQQGQILWKPLDHASIGSRNSVMQAHGRQRTRNRPA
jgi:hypothetical protein